MSNNEEICYDDQISPKYDRLGMVTRLWIQTKNMLDILEAW